MWSYWQTLLYSCPSRISFTFLSLCSPRFWDGLAFPTEFFTPETTVSRDIQWPHRPRPLSLSLVNVFSENNLKKSYELPSPVPLSDDHKVYFHVPLMAESTLFSKEGHCILDNFDFNSVPCPWKMLPKTPNVWLVLDISELPISPPCTLGYYKVK